MNQFIALTIFSLEIFTCSMTLGNGIPQKIKDFQLMITPTLSRFNDSDEDTAPRMVKSDVTNNI